MTPTADIFVFPYSGSKRGTAIRVPKEVEIRVDRVIARASIATSSDLSSDFVHHLLTCGACWVANRRRCARQSHVAVLLDAERSDLSRFAMATGASADSEAIEPAPGAL